MANYGVTPAGFIRKPLDVILADIQAQLSSPAVFGPGVVQSPESPLGQINAAMASIAATAWEIAEATYQSVDPDQAEGMRLDMLAKLRLLSRTIGEADASLRADMTNAGRANIDLSDLARAVRQTAGVSWSRVWINDTPFANANGQDAHSICIAALGGADDDLAAAFLSFVAPGVGSHGNTPVQVSEGGYCRQVNVMRPTELRIGLTMTIRAVPDRNGCLPPSNAQIAATIAAAFAGSDRPANGEDITLPLLNRIVSCLFTNVEIVSATVTRPDLSTSHSLPYAIAFSQIASVGVADIVLSRA